MIGATVRSRADQVAAAVDQRSLWLTVTAAAAVVLLLPLLSGSYLPVWSYWRDVAVSSVIFFGLFWLLGQFEQPGRLSLTLVERYPVVALALVFVAIAVALNIFVFENIPHVSDEVAYQFQAKALALGKLYLPAPAESQFFGFVHTINEGGRWYGIMNPGWPAVLAIGLVLRVPWLINPLIGGLTLLVFYSFFRRAAYSTLETRIAVLLMAISPFLLFMSGTLMAHPLNLLLFGVFLWAWTGIFSSGRWWYGVLAGAALGVNLLVRPIDAGTAALPFIAQLCIRALRERKLLQHVAIVGMVAAVGIVITLLYNNALTGDPRVMPMTKYFVDRNPNEKFGMGFGPNMGTTLHGDEFPGYYPLDAVRVTSYRLAELLRDLNGLPLVVMSFLLLPFARRTARSGEWHRLLLLSGLCIMGIYVLHFYHGIAYGSRHYFLVVPALAVAIARPLSGWLTSPQANVRKWARAGLAAGLIVAATYPYARVFPEYTNRYREASGAIRAAVESRNLSNAVVFVTLNAWAWKSAFPLNDYPLDSTPVIFAKDLGPENRKLIARYPGRSFYSLRVERGRVRIDAMPASP